MTRPFDVSPEVYQALVEQLPAVVYVDSDEAAPASLYVSPNVEEILGYPTERYIARAETFVETIHPEDRDRVMLEWAQAVRTGDPFSSEYRFVRPDGRDVWVRDSSRLIRDEVGRRLFWQGVILDVTAQKHAEQELRESETRYRALIEHIPAVIYEMGPDDDRRTIYVNPYVEEVLGYSRAEWLDQPDIWTELLHPDDRETELAAHDRHNETGEPWRREYRLTAADGRTVWVRDLAELVSSTDGDAPRWQGVMLDITAQKEAEGFLLDARDDLEFRVAARTAALADTNELMGLEVAERRRAEAEATRAEERLRVLVEHLPAVVYTWNILDPELEYTSPQIEDLLGYTPDEWSDTGLWTQRLHPHDRDRVLGAAAHCADTGDPLNIEYRYLDREGRVVWVLDRATVIRRDEAGRPATYQGVMLPIAARKAAEEKAWQAETRYRMLTEQGPVIAYIWHRRSEGPQSPYSYLSPQIEQTLGYPVERWNADVGFWSSILHPDDRAAAAAMDDEAKVTGEPWSMDYRVIAADGRVVWLHDEGRMLERDEAGEPSVFQGVFLDISDRKEAEERLREAESRYRALVEQMPAVPWTKTVDPVTRRGRIVYIGPQVRELLGYTPDELLGESDRLETMVHPDDRERVRAQAAHCEETGEPWDSRFRVYRRDGRIVRLWSKAILTTDGAGLPVWQGVTIDVTTMPWDEAPGPAPADASTGAPAPRPSHRPAGGSP